jgi:hypothetical protein
MRLLLLAVVFWMIFELLWSYYRVVYIWENVKISKGIIIAVVVSAVRSTSTLVAGVTDTTDFGRMGMEQRGRKLLLLLVLRNVVVVTTPPPLLVATDNDS